MSALDCILIGYNDVDLARVEKSLETIQKWSGGYRNFRTNTVRFRGRRIPYMALLNETVRDVSGRDPELHVAQLPNLGAAYLKSFLARRGISVELVNFFNREKDRLQELFARGPRLVAITTTFY